MGNIYSDTGNENQELTQINNELKHKNENLLKTNNDLKPIMGLKLIRDCANITSYFFRPF